MITTNDMERGGSVTQTAPVKLNIITTGAVHNDPPPGPPKRLDLSKMITTHDAPRSENPEPEAAPVSAPEKPARGRK